MNRRHHFQISYLIKNQNIMQQSAKYDYNNLFVSQYIDGMITQEIGVTHGFDANSVFCPTDE
jgi:hypothetical protein